MLQTYTLIMKVFLLRIAFVLKWKNRYLKKELSAVDHGFTGVPPYCFKSAGSNEEAQNWTHLFCNTLSSAHRAHSYVSQH
jgi:hypothetical protein